MKASAILPVVLLGAFAMAAQAIWFLSGQDLFADKEISLSLFTTAALAWTVAGLIAARRWRRPPPLAWLAGLLPAAVLLQDHLLFRVILEQDAGLDALFSLRPIPTWMFFLCAPLALVCGVLLTVAWRQASLQIPDAQGQSHRNNPILPLLGFIAGALLLHAFLLSRQDRPPPPPVIVKAQSIPVDTTDPQGGLEWDATHPVLATLARQHRDDGGWLRKEGEAGGSSFSYLFHEKATSYAFLTSSLAPKVEGFSGPMTLAVLVDGEGRLLDMAIAESPDTSNWLRMLDPWMASMKGMAIHSAEGLEEIDTVSGATYSSRAVVTLLRHAGPAFAKAVLSTETPPLPEVAEEAPREKPTLSVPPRIEWPAVALALALPLILLLRRRPSRPWRLAFLAVVALLFGVGWNLQFSTAQIPAFLTGKWPAAGWTLPFVLAAGIPLAVLLFGNLYCGWLCPFGAVQELADALRPASWPALPTGTVFRTGRILKVGLLLVLLSLAAWRPDMDATRFDLLIHAFSPTRSAVIWGALAAVVILAVFIPRFWCRCLCPTGAFLGLLGGFSPLRRKPPIVPGRCDLGVRTSRDLTCILCDRCRQKSE